MGVKRHDLIKSFTDSYLVNSVTGCWEWQKPLNEKGYGRFLFNGVRSFAHRFSYITYIGELEKGEMQVCHKCDNPKCCNPFHLFKGTNLENQQDAFGKGRRKHAGHGSLAMYSNNGCKCDKCMLAMREYATFLREKNRDHLRQYQKEYKIKNADRLKKQQSDYLEKTKDKRKQYASNYNKKRKIKLGIPDRTVATHGTYSMYSNHRCRCDACREAGLQYSIAKTKRNNPNAYQPKPIIHGSRCTYAKYKCRCDACCVAHNDFLIWRRANRKDK